MYIYIYEIMKTMYPPGYHHNGFVATHAFGHTIYGYNTYIYNMYIHNINMHILILVFILIHININM